MNPENTALILIGYQNDYFLDTGILRGAIEESAVATNTLENTLKLLDNVQETGLTLIQTPIIFKEDYSELKNPVGILRTIREVEAFKQGTSGSEIIDEFKERGDDIKVVPGKHGLNAFSNTELNTILQDNDIENVVLAGAVTSVCIDSTGRSAADRGYQVFVLSDCTCGRSKFEQDFYCTQVLPLYATVLSSEELVGNFKTG